MARDNPYGAFNFEVTAGSLEAGFQEVSGLGTEVTVAEYRNGNDKENHVRKTGGISKASDVTLKRGVIGSASFFAWVKSVRDGDQAAMHLPVTIKLFDEAHTTVVMTWQLTNAFPSKYTGPTLSAKGGTDVAMEELVLVCEKIEVVT
jgi:phage tail-like protein